LRQKSKISAGWRMVTFKDGEIQRRPLVESSDVPPANEVPIPGYKKGVRGSRVR